MIEKSLKGNQPAYLNMNTVRKPSGPRWLWPCFVRGGGTGVRRIEVGIVLFESLTTLIFLLHFRTRPLMRKGKSTESSSTTSQTSAPKPRAPVPSAIKSRTPIHSAMRSRVPVARITSHSCVKPAISTTTTQISTRVLRSHVFSKTSSSVCR